MLLELSQDELNFLYRAFENFDITKHLIMKKLGDNMEDKVEIKNEYTVKNLEGIELWREYEFPGRDTAYRIKNPKSVVMRNGGATHRVVDSHGIAHCVPAPGVNGCVLRWKSVDENKPVEF